MTNSTSRRRATLADVAERAGASKTAVSYVVSGSDRPMSEELRTRITTALDELDYRPDRVARALRNRTTNPLFGLLVPNVSMPFFSQITNSVQRTAEEHNHLMLFANTDFSPHKESEAASRLIDSGVDGLIVLGEGDGSATANLCGASRVPVVWVHNDRGVDPRLHVTADHRAAGIMATEHVLSTNPNTLSVFVGGFTEDETKLVRRETVERRYRGFRIAVENVGARADRIPTDLTSHGAYREVSAYLSGLSSDAPVPGSFVVGTHGQADAVVKAVSDAGLTVPNDVSVVTFDGDTNDFHPFPVTTVRQDLDALVDNAFQLLLNGEGATLKPIGFSLEAGATTGGGKR